MRVSVRDDMLSYIHYRQGRWHGVGHAVGDGASFVVILVVSVFALYFSYASYFAWRVVLVVHMMCSLTGCSASSFLHAPSQGFSYSMCHKLWRLCIVCMVLLTTVCCCRTKLVTNGMFFMLVSDMCSGD